MGSEDAAVEKGDDDEEDDPREKLEDEPRLQGVGVDADADADAVEARIKVVFNPKRKTEKRKASPDHVLVRGPWVESAFNFFKVPDTEVVLQNETVRVVFNVFPICDHHFLVHSQRPLAQNFADADSLPFLIFSLQMAMELRPDRWLLGFNSFGSFASVNHLHTHIMPHPIQGNGLSVLEAAAVTPFAEYEWGTVLAPSRAGPKHTIECIVFELSEDDEQLESFAEALRLFLGALAQENIAHNFLSLDVPGRPLRIVIFPRAKVSFPKEDARVVPGGFEIFGMPIVFDHDFFESFSSQDYMDLRRGCEMDRTQLEDLLQLMLRVWADASP
ncbi:GDP-D-glucose phosphorylase 1 [Hondaea fermentalgiana]|uniref:GDP-D-glucose phosphorylase 1 n=1 Tax=Hondaea fermentalgiana TaxID=2315210 RepID=A0A2R5G7W5_9STRA|nr:GDP-D-glucose phosphorylase 1 [Hondaea fermentalgiana]|eukprot:GBG26419.1 GDP-D-glucose phosphorylase 1 [Hondaea fermentalgiana]